MVEMDGNRRTSNKILLAVSIGLVLALAYLVLKTQVDVHKIVLLLSPVLAVGGAFLASLTAEKGKALGSLLVGLAILSLVLVGTGLLPRVLDWKDHTGVFLKPGDNLYENRFVKDSDSKLLEKLNPYARFYANQLYIREALVSQLLPKNFRIVALEGTTFSSRVGGGPYYVVSSNRNGVEHFKSTSPSEVLVVDTEEIKVWEYKNVERIHED